MEWLKGNWDEVIIGFIILLAALALFRLLDEELGSDICRTGVVVGREYTPISQVQMANGNDGYTTLIIPEAYYLKVETKEGIARVPVQPYEYNNMSDGQNIKFVDKKGFFTGTRYKK
jgi:hypothetical protein